MGDRDLHLRHVLVEKILDAGEILDPRHHVERLSAAIALAQQRLADHQGIVRRDEGAHREPIDRRRGDDREIAHAGQRQLQRARDRRRAQRQHMHLGAQLLQPLLVADAEMLLLVDDQQAEIPELDRLAEQRMGADHDIDRAVGKALLDLRQLLGRDQARGLRDIDRKTAEPLGEGLGVLARQQRGRHHDGDLLAVERDRERRAQRHLGLAEADVAADQPVHRPAGFEILQGRIDGAELVLGLLIGKARAEFVIDMRLHRHFRRFVQMPFGGDLDQFAGDLADAVLQLGLARLPAAAAEPVEFDIGVVGAVARQQFDILDRQEQFCFGGVMQFEAVMRRAGDLERLQADEAADAVLDMDHEIAGARLVTSEMKLSSLRLALRGRTRRSPRMSCSLMTATWSVSKPDSMPTTASMASLRGVACTVRQVLTLVRLSSLWSCSMLPMRSREPSLHSAITTFLRWACSACTCATTASNTLTDAVGALRREIAALPRAGIDHVGAALGHRERRQPRQRGLVEPLGPFVFGQIEPVRRQRLVDRAAAGMLQRLAPRLVIIGDLLEALARGVLALRLDRDRRVVEIVEQRIHPLLEQRQPVFHAGMAAAFADRLVQQIVALRRAEGCDIAHPEAADGLGHQLKFRDRHQIERAHVEQRALGFGIETADRFQAVAEEIEPHGLVEPGRKQIEDAAAHGVFAGLAHRRGAVVAVVLQPGDDGVHRHHMAGRHRQRLRGDDFARRHPLHDGVDRGQHDQRLVAAGQPRQPRQRGQPLRQDAAMRRDPVVGLAVPGRKLHAPADRARRIPARGPVAACAGRRGRPPRG